MAQIPFVLVDGPPEDRLRLEFLSFARTGPSYVGLRREDNNTLQKFLQAWAEWNNLLGYTDARIKKYLESAGATNIPENVRF